MMSDMNIASSMKRLLKCYWVGSQNLSCMRRTVTYWWLEIIYCKVYTIENNTNLNSIFCLIKSSKIGFIFLPAFYLIMWLMTSPKNFEKIAILKKWQLVFFWGVKTYFGEIPLKPLKLCIFRHEIFYLYQYCPSNSYCSHQM